MTELQIIRNLHKEYSFIIETIRKLSEIMPSIKRKYCNGKLWPGTEFNLKETTAIYKAAGANELQLTLLEENWVDKVSPEVYTIKGTEDYVRKFNENNRIKCCNTCEYLRGKTTDKIIPKPFCSVYEKFLRNFNANVYEDYCNSYKYNGLLMPRLWYKDNAPINLNKFGKTDTINGIERSRLNVEKKKGDPVIIVDKVGF